MHSWLVSLGLVVSSSFQTPTQFSRHTLEMHQPSWSCNFLRINQVLNEQEIWCQLKHDIFTFWKMAESTDIQFVTLQEDIFKAGLWNSQRLQFDAIPAELLVPQLPRQSEKVVAQKISEITLPWDSVLIAAHAFRIATKNVSKNLYLVLPGKYKEELPKENRPWRGYWYPYKDAPLAAGSNPPLSLYDQWVNLKTGVNPKSVDWELEIHSLDDVEWGGHCNGWAAASILYPEPKKPVYLPELGVSLSVWDQKGLLNEASYCANWLFYGSRNNSRQPDFTDISAELFHKALIYSIKVLRRPIAYDRYNDDKVDNYVISRYEFKISKKNNEGRVSVRARLKVHVYDRDIDNKVGEARSFEPYFDYYLWTDDQGNILKGEWKRGESNPDFVWIPLNQMKCRGENPRVEHQFVEQMLFGEVLNP
ncbi:MAG: hypothetical protein COT74_03155 [Bdellovibrionales bacterium CG10_big_fil_rev_8_21_14_0_10_45_34]|nr:MAG: hypothetical protein COT74_03155 [Bdellovibrionales bacterium CG10_big_fil_rev_8_21_14_0_10_45_34]